MNSVMSSGRAALAGVVALLLVGCETKLGGGGRGAPLAAGAMAPAIQAAGWINGPGPTAADLASKVVVVDCWAYW